MSHHIYLIDDDEDEIEFFHEAVNVMENPVAFTYARGSVEGLKKLKFFHPTLIFIDYNMPGMCGLDCMIEILKMRPEKNYKAFLYSNALTPLLVEQAMQAGATYCFKKPAQMETLAAMLDNLSSAHDGAKYFAFEQEKKRGAK